MRAVSRLTVRDLVADSTLVEQLIAEGETLFVERKERDPRNGLGATIASFANMLGGWLLIGVDDDGNVVGYEPPGRVDLQDYIRQLLGAQVDPLPPFAALSVAVRDQKIGIVRVAESSDQPHITSEGVVYRRTPGGKVRVTEARDIIAMARRGEQARLEAEQVRLYGLRLISNAMATPERIYGDDPSRTDHPPILEWIVRASPYTLSGPFADRALSRHAAELAKRVVASLFPAPSTGPMTVGTEVEARARGLYCEGAQQGVLMLADLAIDAGGTVAVRTAQRRQRGVLPLRPYAAELGELIRAAATVLSELDGYGRAAVGLEVRGAGGVTVQWSPSQIGVLEPGYLIDGHRLQVGGDLAVPATDDDVAALANRWIRELGRAARLSVWEPGPESAGSTDERA